MSELPTDPPEVVTPPESAAALEPAAARRATAFALAVVFLDCVGFGLVLPVLPPLIEEVGGVGLDDAARVGGWMFALFSLAQFVCAPLVGGLSDRFGRRPLLLLAVAGLAVDYVVHALAPSIGWLYVGRLFAGVCGSSWVIANACLADASRPEDRARAFGLMAAAFGLGFVLGPAIGGLLGAFGTRVPFWCAAALAAANFVFGLIALPETLPADRRRAFRWREANPFGAFVVFRAHGSVLPLAGVLTLYFFATSVYVAIWSFWGVAKYGWSASTTGITLAVSGAAMALMQGIVTGPAVARFGERPLVLAGLVIGAASCFAYGLAPTTAMVLPILVVHAVEGFVHPMLSAMMSRAVPEDAQGALQGGLSAGMNLAMLAGTIAFTQIFGFFLTPHAPIVGPDVAFHVAGALMVLAVGLFVVVTRSRTA